MDKKLPARPNLDHLRRQAKELLGALASGDKAAVTTIQKHLPAAKGLSAAQVRDGRFRLADAQSAIARQSGFSAWPDLARHVELLRALEGEWTVTHLVTDGTVLPAGALQATRILIDGDRFRTESPDATYEGVFNINVGVQPNEIDIEFVAGPEAGNWNHGIFRFADDRLELCLDLNGRPRPKEFRSPAGSGWAHETLHRASKSRPPAVTGGKPAEKSPAPAVPIDRNAFAYVKSETMRKLEGEWTAVQVVRDGQPLPAPLLTSGRRTAARNEIKISFGGRIAIHALVRMDERAEPVTVDYLNIGGANQGTVQLGIFRWDGREACFCMAAPGQSRPTAFSSTCGSGHTLSQWRPR